jgi:hypothetical protein
VRRRSVPEDDLPDGTRALLDVAIRTHGATLLWNMRPRRTRAGAASLARALETRGDLAAARLAQEIRASLAGDLPDSPELATPHAPDPDAPADFFKPIPDPEGGSRRHVADLAVDALVACAGGKRSRDFVALWMVDRCAIPLWRLAIAAPGKDAGWSPLSILERLSRNMAFSREDFEGGHGIEFDPASAMRELAASIEAARIRIPEVPPRRYGALEIRDGEIVILDEASTEDSTWIHPSKGGTITAPAGDSRIVHRFTESFGIDGSSLAQMLRRP